MTDFALLDSSTLISRKIWVEWLQKFWALCMNWEQRSKWWRSFSLELAFFSARKDPKVYMATFSRRLWIQMMATFWIDLWNASSFSLLNLGKNLCISRNLPEFVILSLQKYPQTLSDRIPIKKSLLNHFPMVELNQICMIAFKSRKKGRISQCFTELDQKLSRSQLLLLAKQ